MKNASAVSSPGHLDWWLTAEFVEESAAGGNALVALGSSAGSNSCSHVVVGPLTWRNFPITAKALGK